MNLTKYGVYDVNINGVKCKCVYLPKPPKNDKDAYLANVYASSLKPTTFNNMYSKWLNAVRQRLCKYKGDVYNCKCQILILNLDVENKQMTPYALTTSIQCLVTNVIDDVSNMNIITFKTMQNNLDALLMFVAPIDENLIYLDDEDVKKLVDEIN